MKVSPFVHEGLGNSSYLVELHGAIAVLVDPDRSVDRYLQEIEARGLRLAAVLETHLHADFVTGASELLALAGVKPHAPGGGDLKFPHHAVDGNDRFPVGEFQVSVIGSPGHTPEHVSYLLEAPAGGPPLLFSGGSLIVGGAARTDLISPDLTEDLTRAQYRTLRHAFTGLPDATHLYPTHGGGSFCSVGVGEQRTSTLGDERAQNPLMRFDDEEEFAGWFPGTFPAAPDYFFRMRAINQAGPRLRSEVRMPPAMDADKFRMASSAGVIIDTRPIEQYHRGHITGALSIAFRPSFATWLGWLTEPGLPLYFVTGEEPIEEVVRESLLVGYDTFGGWLAGGVEAWQQAGFALRNSDSVTLDEAREMLQKGASVLDVRETGEFAAGHLDGAVNIPLGSLVASPPKIPTGKPTIAYCGHGERSTTALSLLERHGIRAVNLEKGFPG